MALKNRILDSVFCLAVGTAYAFALAGGILSGTILEAEPRFVFGWCLCFVALWSLLFFNRWTMLLSLGLLLAGGIGLFLALWRQEFQAPWFLNLVSVLKDLWEFMNHQTGYRPEFDGILVVAMAFLVSLITVLNLRVHFGFYILIVGALAAFAIPLYMEWGRNDLAIFLMALCFVVLLVRKLNLIATLRDARGERWNSGVALALIPVCVGAFALAWYAPKPNVEAIREGGLPDIAGAADNLLFGLMPDQVFSWSEEGARLGGPRTPDDVYVMEVDAPRQVYLAGSIRDQYTGSAWNRTLSGSIPLEPDAGGGYDVGSHSPLQSGQRYFMNYYAWEIEEVTITTGEARTKTIYAPPSPQRLSITEVAPSLDPYGILQASKPLDKEFTYSVSCIPWYYDNHYFQYILETAAGDREPGMTREELAPYLALPDALPQRVLDLTQQITAGLGTDYAKLTAIQEYLQQFPYTLSPGAVPAGADFVDHFLFEEREGYCVYYATAMAVMGRAAGVPTRYVEGFVLPRHKNINDKYTVTNQQAHAWVEAFFPGFGWVVFEPTPAGGQGFDPQPAPGVEEESSAPEEPEPSPQESAPSEPEEESPREASRPVSRPSSPESSPEESLPDGEDPGKGKGGLRPRHAAAIALALAGAAVFLLRRPKSRGARRQAAEQHIAALSNREAVAAWFGRLLGAAEELGYPMLPGETALAYAGRVGDSLALTGCSLWELALLFCRASYSNREVTDADRALMKAACRELEARLPPGQPSPPGGNRPR